MLALSLDTIYANPIVPKFALEANPFLIGKRAMDIADIVIGELQARNVMVVLNIHVNQQGWCCSQTNENGLWNTNQYPTSKFMQGLQDYTRRYKTYSHVVAFDLKNEFHDYQNTIQTYGQSLDINTDWKIAAEEGGKMVQKENPDLLVIVGGMCFNYYTFGMQYNLPVMTHPNKLVLTTHAYSFNLWWILLDELMKKELGFNLSSLSVVSPIIATLCVLCIVLMFRRPWGTQKDDNVAHYIKTASWEDYVSASAIWSLILSVLVYLWFQFGQFVYYKGACGYMAMQYDYSVFVCIVIMALSSSGILLALLFPTVNRMIGKPKLEGSAGRASQAQEMRPIDVEAGTDDDVVQVRVARASSASADEDELIGGPRSRPPGPSGDEGEEVPTKNPLDKKYEPVKQDNVPGGPRPFRYSESAPVVHIRLSQPRWCVIYTGGCCSITTLFGLIVVATYFIYLGHSTSRLADMQASVKTEYDTAWGTQYTKVPIWVGEFGTSGPDDPWWPAIVKYIKDNELSWSYWPLDGRKITVADSINGTYTKTYIQWFNATGMFEDERFGLLDETFTKLNPNKLSMIQDLKSISDFLGDDNKGGIFNP